MEPQMSGKGFRERFIGKSVDELDTPVIVADLDALEANLFLLSGYFSGRRCRVRPHFKSHKCVTLARRQLACPNTVGITCAKISEAEVLVEGGVEDVLLANQLIGRSKVRRLARLNRQAMVRGVVDSRPGVDWLGAAARDEGVTIGVLVEVDVGMNRAGVLPGGPALELAELVARTGGLRFDGLQGYEGHLVTTENYEERCRLVAKALAPLIETRKAIEAAGLTVSIVSSGGTGTYDITGNIEGVDEVQCGSYALMDAQYRRVRPEFSNARHVLATVISTRGEKAVADVGLKGMGAEYASPVVAGHPEAEVLYVAEEHTVIENLAAAPGDRISLIPPHGCTTNNLYERMWLVRQDIIEDVWPIEGRGCLE